MLQVDSAGIGKRETDLRLTPGGSAPRSKATKRRWADDLTWDDIPWFRSFTKMPIVLKGVQVCLHADPLVLCSGVLCSVCRIRGI
jgi:hypothetical protein